MRQILSNVVARVGHFLSNRAATFAVLCMLALGAPSLFAEGVTIPSTDIDIPGHVTAVIAALSVIMASVIGGIIAFWLVKKGLRMMRSIG